jgi:hypothetical protein
MKNEGGIRIDDVLFRAYVIQGGSRFGELKVSGDRSILRQPTTGTPPSVLDAKFDRRFQRGSIHAGLPPRDDTTKRKFSGDAFSHAGKR